MTAGAGLIVSVAVALVSPSADAVMVAFPNVDAVKLDCATPFAATTEDGLNVPATPVTAKLMMLFAVVMVLPPASLIDAM